MKRFFLIVLMLFISQFSFKAQQLDRPLILPFQDSPGLNTWLLGQAYGNTTGAYANAVRWYSAGQGLHFGIDYAAACGTPLVAVADATVMFVDNLGFGSAPHNLILRHDELGLVSLYGHLLQTPDLTQGQTLQQGDFVGYSGDPDGTCDSRPHLHYELRSLDYRTAYNPVPYTDANWNTLALIGSFSSRFFQMDLDNARRWMNLDDQPDVAFGGQRLNNYTAIWPPRGSQSAPPSAPLARSMPPIRQSEVTLSPLESSGCCYDFWWHPTDPALLYTVDGFENQRAQLFKWDTASRTLLSLVSPMPVPFYSPDFSHTIRGVDNGAQIQRLSDGATWIVNTGDAIPAINPGNTRLMWIQRGGDNVPGQAAPTNTIYVSDIVGNQTQALFTEQGIAAVWLDANRLLLTIRQRPYTQVDVYDLIQQERYTLGLWYRPRGISIAPGGEHLMFYLATQPNPEDTGLYVIETGPNSQARKLEWFGAWRWRDDRSAYYIPYQLNSPTQQLLYYDLQSGETQILTNPISQPFAVMNGQWLVNADGSQIIFRNSLDRNLWLLTITTP